jgi:hypothetical protein
MSLIQKITSFGHLTNPKPKVKSEFLLRLRKCRNLTADLAQAAFFALAQFTWPVEEIQPILEMLKVKGARPTFPRIENALQNCLMDWEPDSNRQFDAIWELPAKDIGPLAIAAASDNLVLVGLILVIWPRANYHLVAKYPTSVAMLHLFGKAVLWSPYLAAEFAHRIQHKELSYALSECKVTVEDYLGPEEIRWMIYDLLTDQKDQTALLKEISVRFADRICYSLIIFDCAKDYRVLKRFFQIFGIEKPLQLPLSESVLAVLISSQPISPTIFQPSLEGADISGLYMPGDPRRFDKFMLALTSGAEIRPRVWADVFQMDDVDFLDRFLRPDSKISNGEKITCSLAMIQAMLTVNKDFAKSISMSGCAKKYKVDVNWLLDKNIPADTETVPYILISYQGDHRDKVFLRLVDAGVVDRPFYGGLIREISTREYQKKLREILF